MLGRIDTSLHKHYPTVYERSQKVWKKCIGQFSATRPLSATPRWEFVVHTNSTKVLHMNSTKVVHMNTNDTNSTKVVHMNSVHGKVVTHSGVATNSTCVSSAPHSRLNIRSSIDSQSGKQRLELLLLLFYSSTW